MQGRAPPGGLLKCCSAVHVRRQSMLLWVGCHARAQKIGPCNKAGTSRSLNERRVVVADISIGSFGLLASLPSRPA
jgi:hypothetical protein